MIYIIFIILLTAVGSVFPQSLERVRFTWETRYDNIQHGRDENRLEAALRLNFTIDLFEDIKLINLLSSGSKFTSRWETLRNFNDPDKFRTFKLNLRQLYLQRDFSWGRIQLGAIPPVKGRVSSTGLASNGWIDGARVVYKLPWVNAEFLLGSKADFNQPNLFERELVLNFSETEFSFQASENLRGEFSFEKLNEESYLRSEAGYTFNKGKSNELEITTEGLYNTNTKKWSYGTTLFTDPLAHLHGSLAGYVTMIAYYNYTDEHIGLRGELTDDFYVFGHSLTLEFEGPITSDGKLSWFFKPILAKEERYNIGIEMSLSMGDNR